MYLMYYAHVRIHSMYLLMYVLHIQLSTSDVERVVLSAQSEELTSGAKDPVIKDPTAKPSRPSSKRPRGDQTGSHSLTKRRKAQVTPATTKDQTEQDQTCMYKCREVPIL